MAQPSVYVREKIAGKWKHIKIEEGRGRKTGDLEPPFFVRPFVNGKQTWRKLDAQTFKAAKDEAVHIGTDTLKASIENRVPIEAAVDRFISEAIKSKKPGTVQDYKLHLRQFIESLGGKVEYIDQVGTDTIGAFRDWMQEKGYSAKTQHNRIVTALSLLKKNNTKTAFSLANDLPDVEDEPAIPFEPDVLRKLFAAMTPEERVRYKFFLGTACRDKEVTYASWADIDFAKNLYHIRRKPDVGFTPKNHESRTVRMPTDLVALLQKRRKADPNARWIFVNDEGRPDNHFLRKLKRIALRAGVNCAHCKTVVTKGKYHKKREVEVTCKTDPVCEHIYLHRLRKTCASNWERAGVPIRTIQYMLGHKSLETTMKYLGITGMDQIGDKIDVASSAAVGD
jgi:integrase/recombinase XerD